MDRAHPAKSDRNLGKALCRGAGGRCPNCGIGQLFDGFLTSRDTCDICGIDLRRHAPAAGPAFLSIAVASLLMAPLMGLATAIFGPDPAIVAAIGIATIPALAVLLLRVIKGAMIGYLWAFDAENRSNSDTEHR
jgi:uncharacterized protein (DUF983 family)